MKKRHMSTQLKVSDAGKVWGRSQEEPCRLGDEQSPKEGSCHLLGLQLVTGMSQAALCRDDLLCRSLCRAGVLRKSMLNWTKTIWAKLLSAYTLGSPRPKKEGKESQGDGKEEKNRYKCHTAPLGLCCLGTKLCIVFSCLLVGRRCQIFVQKGCQRLHKK